MKATKWKPRPTLFPSEQCFLDTWESLASSVPRKGPPGITHYAGVHQVLVYRDENGIFRGRVMLESEWKNHGFELKLEILVDPDHWREGIGTALMNEAVKRWKINFRAQSYTPYGAVFFAKFLESESEK
jgi:GNAT superfamily N-acetyltransferase